MASVSEDDVFSSGNGDSDVVVEEIDSQLYPNHLLPDMFLPQTDLYLECSEENSLDSLSGPLDSMSSSAGQNVSLRSSSSSDSSFAVGDGVVSRNNSETTSDMSGLNQASLPEHFQSADVHSACTARASSTSQGVLSHCGPVPQPVTDVQVSAAAARQAVQVERASWKTTFVCSVCQKAWPTAHKLARHSLSHNAYHFSCQEPGCSKTFKHRPALLDHQRVVHRKGQTTPGASSTGAGRRSRGKSASQSKFQCPWPGCGKSFRDGHNLRVHHCLHTGDTPLSCSLCSYRCVQKASLNWHVKKMHN